MSGINLESDIKNSLNIYFEYFSKILPSFGFMLGLTVVSQIILVLGGSIAMYYLALENYLNEIVSAFNAGEHQHILEIIIQEPNFLVLLSVVFLIMAFVSLIGYSGIYGGILQLTKDTYTEPEVNLSSGLLGSKKYFKRISFLYLLLFGVVTMLVFPSFFLLNLTPLVGVLYLFGVSLVILFLYVFLFSFAKEALVAENLEVFESIRNSFSFVKNNFPEVIFYFSMFLITMFFVGSINLIFSSVFSATLQGLTNFLMVFLIYPFFVLLKMNMYSDHIDFMSKTVPRKRFNLKIKKGFRKSVNELTSFCKNNYFKIFFVFSFLVIGGFFGKLIGDVSPTIKLGQLTETGFSSSMVFHIMFHNITTATGIMFSGVILGLPTIGAILFNGVILGVVYVYVENLNVFLVGILPHGVLEIPALCIAGSMGLKIGKNFLEFIKNEKDIVYVGETIERLFYGIIGTIPLFVAAAFIESFITPYLLSLVTNHPM